MTINRTKKRIIDTLTAEATGILRDNADHARRVLGREDLAEEIEGLEVAVSFTDDDCQRSDCAEDVSTLYAASAIASVDIKDGRLDEAYERLGDAMGSVNIYGVDESNAIAAASDPLVPGGLSGLADGEAISKPEPPPQPGKHDVALWLENWLADKFDLSGATWASAQNLLNERVAFGLEKYGTRLQSHNGRDPSEDARQEIGDALQYVAQCHLEGRDVSEIRKLAELLEILACVGHEGVENCLENECPSRQRPAEESTAANAKCAPAEDAEKSGGEGSDSTGTATAGRLDLQLRGLLTDIQTGDWIVNLEMSPTKRGIVPIAGHVAQCTDINVLDKSIWRLATPYEMHLHDVGQGWDAKGSVRLATPTELHTAGIIDEIPNSPEIPNGGEVLDLTKLQAAHKRWCAENFDHREHVLPRKVLHCAMGVSEEAGELMHALLKWDQGIRGDAEKHEAEAKDAVGDVVMYLLDLCNRMGWQFDEVVAETAETVHGRDWNERGEQ